MEYTRVKKITDRTHRTEHIRNTSNNIQITQSPQNMTEIKDKILKSIKGVRTC